ncbi:MAG TPA: ChaN family lipoprotein [Vicinamibacterales bacterium]|nr:ChaN family lipoprotein [Vicinamibacterales bacterium]
MRIRPSGCRAAIAALVLLTAAPPALAQNKLLHLPIGDPGRRDREAPLALDAITDTGTGDLLTPVDLPARLAGTSLLLIGEEHTNMESHCVQLRVLQALVDAGRPVLIGLEMYPYTEQRFLDRWHEGTMSEEQFVRESRWYDNWGYNWLYYRDIFLFARDRRIPMFAVNTPRDVVSAVRKKGLANLSPGEAAHIPKEIDAEDPDHMLYFKTTFEGQEGPVHGAGMSEEMWKNMLGAQATWDATMGYNAVQALKQAKDRNAIMVVLVGLGHVAYGLGIERQARQWYDGGIASLIPVAVRGEDGPVASVRASYANFLWGVPETMDSHYPTLGLSTAVGQGDAARRVIIVQKNSVAERAGIAVGDVLLSVDGVPLEDKEAYNRLIAAKRWGDPARIVVRRGGEEVTLTAVFRRMVKRQ